MTDGVACFIQKTRSRKIIRTILVHFKESQQRPSGMIAVSFVLITNAKDSKNNNFLWGLNKSKKDKGDRANELMS